MNLLEILKSIDPVQAEETRRTLQTIEFSTADQKLVDGFNEYIDKLIEIGSMSYGEPFQKGLTSTLFGCLIGEIKSHPKYGKVNGMEIQGGFYINGNGDLKPIAEYQSTDNSRLLTIEESRNLRFARRRPI